MMDKFVLWLFSALLLSAALVLRPEPLLAQEVSTPNFWDQRQRMTKPPLGERERIRFLTTTDYPPFNFLDPRGRLGGFNVDLVRSICEELDILSRCQIEALPFDQLLPALQRGEGDAIIAGLAITPAHRQTLEFTEPYFRYPARFVTRKAEPIAEPVSLNVAGKKIGVAEGGAHAAMLAAFFPKAVSVPYENRTLALDALKKGEIDAVFGDGVGLSFWLQSNASDECCSFSGGPYLSDRFLGEGLAIAVAQKDADLARSLDYAIGQIVARERFSELLLRYFPISAF